jgi:hypothetical protein
MFNSSTSLPWQILGYENKIVQVLVAYKLANISKKNGLEWVKSHWHAKKFGDHKTNFWVMTTKFVR